MERKVNFNDVMAVAQKRVKEEVLGGFELAKATIAAFTVVAIEARYWRGISTKDERAAMIKKPMMRADMSNGKAAAYSKIVETVMGDMINKYGQPDGAEVNAFWADWRDAKSVDALESIAYTFLTGMAKAETVGALADACGVAYGANKTAKANTEALATAKLKAKAGPARKPTPAAPPVSPETVADVKARYETPQPEAAKAKATPQDVLMAMLSLSDEDQMWVLKALHATKQKKQLAAAA